MNLRYSLLVLLQYAVQTISQSGETSLAAVSTSDGYKYASSFFANSINISVDPCDDFFEFVCGKWISQHPINGITSSVSVMQSLYERTIRKMSVYIGSIDLKTDCSSVNGGLQKVCRAKPSDKLRSIFESKSASDSKSMSGLKTMYRKCMNTEEVNRTGPKQLIDTIRSQGVWPMLEGDSMWHNETFDLTSLLAKVSKVKQLSTFFVHVFIKDVEHPLRKIILVAQGSLGMGPSTRDYYLDKHFSRQLSAYKNFLIRTVMLLQADAKTNINETKIERDVDEIIEMEKNIAAALLSEEHRRDCREIREKLSNLQELVPAINWTLYFQSIAQDALHGYFFSDPEITVWDIDFLKRINELLQSTDSRIITNYVYIQFVDEWQTELGKRYDDIRQEFMSAMYGIKQKPQRWKLCAEEAINSMPFAALAMYIRKNFDQASKILISEIAEEIQEAFLNITAFSSWMDEKTKAAAINKARLMHKYLSYPDFILNSTKLEDYYERLNIQESDSYSQIVSKVIRWWIERNFEQLIKTRNQGDVEVDNPGINSASYRRRSNLIVIPAASLQIPLFHPSFPRALNYAGIGAIIGHEIIHGFDDIGRKYDEEGRVRNWWSFETAEIYEKRAQCFINQYSNTRVIGTNLTIKGRMTQGENIADNEGVRLAFKAYKHYIEEHGEERRIKGLENYTNEQIFFLGYASIWCGHSTPEKIINQITTDAHPPRRYRVNQVLANQHEFATAFNCSATAPLNPSERCTLL